MPPVSGKEEAVTVLYPYSVHLGFCEGWELIKLRVLEVHGTVVVWVIVCVAGSTSAWIDKSSLERTDDLEFLPALQDAHEVFILVGMRQRHSADSMPECS